MNWETIGTVVSAAAAVAALGLSFYGLKQSKANDQAATDARAEAAKANRLAARANEIAAAAQESATRQAESAEKEVALLREQLRNALQPELHVDLERQPNRSYRLRVRLESRALESITATIVDTPAIVFGGSQGDGPHPSASTSWGPVGAGDTVMRRVLLPDRDRPRAMTVRIDATGEHGPWTLSRQVKLPPRVTVYS